MSLSRRLAALAQWTCGASAALFAASLLLLPLSAAGQACTHSPDGRGGSVCDSAGASCTLPTVPTKGTCRSVGSIADSRSCECVTNRVRLNHIVVASLGDSYASGEGSPDPGGVWGGNNSDGMAAMCDRSTGAAPAVAANSLRQVYDVQFLQFSCTGKTIADVINMQLPSLAGAVAPPSTGGGSTPIDALMISIGGNDIGFSQVVVGCVLGPCEPSASQFPQAITDLAPTLMTLVAAIRSTLPGGVKHVFFTEYPDPSSTPFPFPADKCGEVFPLPTPNFGGLELLQVGQEAWATDNVINPLNATLKAAVDKANSTEINGTRWHFVSGISDAFRGHGYCMGVPNIPPPPIPAPYMLEANRWINTVLDALLLGDPKGIMHPNRDGSAGAGKVLGASVLQALSAPVVSSGPNSSNSNTSNSASTTNKRPDPDPDDTERCNGKENCVKR